MSRWRLWWKAFYSVPSLLLLLTSVLAARWLDNAGLLVAGLLADLLLVDWLARMPSLRLETAAESDLQQVRSAWEQFNRMLHELLRRAKVAEGWHQRLRSVRMTTQEIVKAYEAAEQRQLYTPLVLEALDAVKVYGRLVDKRIALARALSAAAGGNAGATPDLEQKVEQLTRQLEQRRQAGTPDQVASLERQLHLRQLELETYRRFVRHLEEIDLRLEETRALLESVRARVVLADLVNLEETGVACHQLLDEMNALDQAVEQLAELRRVQLGN